MSVILARRPWKSRSLQRSGSPEFQADDACSARLGCRYQGHERIRPDSDTKVIYTVGLWSPPWFSSAFGYLRRNLSLGLGRPFDSPPGKPDQIIFMMALILSINYSIVSSQFLPLVDGLHCDLQEEIK